MHSLKDLASYTVRENQLETTRLPQDLVEHLDTLKCSFKSVKDVRCQHCGSTRLFRHLPFGDMDSYQETMRERAGIPIKYNNGVPIDDGKNLKLDLEGDCVFCGDPHDTHECISCHDDDVGEEWFVCRDCKAYHVRCPKCKFPSRLGLSPSPGVHLCRFLGFAGYFHVPKERINSEYDKEDTKYRIPPLEYLEEVGHKDLEYLRDFVEGYQEEPLPSYINEITVEYLDEKASQQYIQDFGLNDNCFYYVGDWNRFYAGVDGEMVTGPDGGFGHDWKCDRCETKYGFTDK